MKLLSEFLDYMKKNGSSEHHQNYNLKVMIGFGIFLGAKKSFHDVKTKQQILAFVDTRVKTHDEDLDKKWITTWNNYLNRMKLFYRWLFNHSNDIEYEYSETPEFFKIKTKKSKRVSPYLERNLLVHLVVHISFFKIFMV